MARRPVAETREALVRATLDLIARGGVTAATTRAVAAEAGLPLASVHYAFESQDELLTAAIAHAVADEGRSVRRMTREAMLGEGETGAVGEAAAAPPTTERVEFDDLARAGLNLYLDGLRADPEREKALLSLTFWALREPATDHLARKQYRQYVEMAVDTLTEFAELVGRPWTITIEQLSPLLVAILDGITVNWLVFRDDAMAELLVDAAVRTLSSYASPRPEELDAARSKAAS